MVKKRQTKKKKNDSASKKDGKSGGSGAGEDGDESDGYEFVIVSYDNKGGVTEELGGHCGNYVYHLDFFFCFPSPSKGSLRNTF